MTAHSNPISKIPEVRLNRLTTNHLIKPFDCEEKDLNEFLIHDAKQLQENLLWVTYVLETPFNTIAYFSVANDRIVIDINDHKNFKHDLRVKYQGAFLYRLFQQRNYPAVKLGRFAVTKEYKRQGIGSELIDYIKYFFIKNNKTGCAFITVDALNKCNATNFYIKNGFDFFTETDCNQETRTMFHCLMINLPKTKKL